MKLPTLWLGAITALLLGCAAVSPDTVTVTATDPVIRWSGRYVGQNNGSVRFGYPSVSAYMTVDGGTLSMIASSSKNGSWLAISVDDQPPRRLALTTTPSRYLVLENASGTHQVKVSHLSETWRGIVTIDRFQLKGGRFAPPPAPAKTKLMVIGDSVTCGEAVHSPVPGQCHTHPREPDSDHAYGILLGARLGAETQLICYGGRGLIRSWNGNTGDLQAPEFFTLSIPEPGEPEADLTQFTPDIILISLGTNDFNLGLGELPPQDEFVDAYTAFVRRLLNTYPKAIITLTEGSIVNDHADPERPQKTVLNRYIAQTVAQVGSPRVYQLASPYYPGDQCDAHPTGEQHKAIADNLWQQLKPLISAQKTLNHNVK